MRLHITALLAITAVAVPGVFLGGADDLQVLLTGLTEPHLDQHLLNIIEAHPPDPRIAPALEAEFDRRGTKSEKQAIAATMIRLGDTSDRLFRFLSLFVLRAVEDRTPFPVMFNSDGHEVRGRFSAEFENWCALNHKEPRSTAAEQLVTFMDDILMLAQTNDWRADTLFRKGLESPNPMVVAASVQGLARLQDFRALPLIADACSRLPKGALRAIAGQLPWYARMDAYRLMEKIEPDPKAREAQIAQVERSRDVEKQRIASRARTPGLK